MFLQVSVILSTGGRAWLLWGAWVVAPRGVWMVAPRGASVVTPRGGMRGCSGGGLYMVSPGGHAWLFRGACVVALGGGCSQGVCMVFQGCVWFFRGHVWFFRWDTVNERAVRILLECILFLEFFTTHQRSCRKVMFSHMSVHHSAQGQVHHVHHEKGHVVPQDIPPSLDIPNPWTYPPYASC